MYEQEKAPKIFISYSWTSSEKVLELAYRLMSHGVEVLLDKWDLKEGQDKYAYMERCVTDPEINKVLLICDKVYADKANKRDGGVGDETIIISPEVYGRVDQEKFIPVIFEMDDDSKPYMPAYVKSRLYINLSADNEKYESEYEKLLRNIHDRPQFQKPPLGHIPQWIDEETVDLAPIRDLIKQINRFSSENKTKLNFLLKNTTDAFTKALNSFPEVIDDNTLLKTIDEMKPLRDLYVDFLETMIFADVQISDTITVFFEQVYNITHDVSDRSSYGNSEFEQYDFFIWECFIATAATLMYYERYAELHDVLCHSYFLRESFFDNANYKDFNYSKFRPYIRTIEEVCKPKCDEPKLYTLTGRMLVQREKKPILSSKSIANADVLLFQLYNIIELKSEGRHYWFPVSYIYCKDKHSMWIRLKSQKYCERILPLFGVPSLTAFKEKLAECKNQREVRHSNCFEAAPNILDSITLEEVASLN